MATANPNNAWSGNWSPSISPVVIAPQVTTFTPNRSVARDCHARVLHLVNGEHFSGAERVQSHLGRCLPEFGIVADFACVKPGKFAEMLDEQNGEWGRGHRVPMANRLDLRVAWKLRCLVRENEYHLLHAHTPRTAMIAAAVAKLAGVPWVYHVHSPASRDSSRLLTNQVNAAIEKISLRRCSHLITVSKSLKQDCLQRGAKFSRVTVVHNGVPAIRPERLVPVPVSGGRWTFGMIALQRPRKGLEVALEALAKLRDRHDVVLRIIGPFETESYEKEINGLIEQLGVAEQIQRVGFTKDVPGELSKLDAMLLPSLFGEGLPMVVLESMAAAVPVIATEVEGTPEAITDGAEGLMAKPGDADSLASKIEELVSGQHDWKAMSEAACRRHAKDFSDKSMAENTARVYRNVLR